jgi:hypothetical protein
VTDPISRLFRACDPSEPLDPSDPRYVNCDEARGENLVRRYERSLRRADPVQPEVKVFTGHLGAGKSSELRRLKKMLEEPQHAGDKPFHVLLMEVDLALDLNDLDLPDLLVFVAGEAQKQLTELRIPGFSATSELLRGAWDGIRDMLGSQVELKGANVDVGFAKLAVELKNRPGARSKLREAIELQSTTLLGAVNDLLSHASVQLRERGYAGLVLLVDGLEKLIRRELPGGGDTHERLFIRRSRQLASLSAHVIYTVPISLIYSPLFAQIEQTFGELTDPMPMIKLRGENRSAPEPGTLGMRTMQEMLQKRCAVAGVPFTDLFDEDATCHYLCEMTGGHPRHLLMFIQAAINGVDSLPLTRKAVERAVRGYANGLLRQIPDDFWPLLRTFDTPQEDIATDDNHQQMLLLLHVFEYMNGNPWWEVNPVLRTLPKFRERK